MWGERETVETVCRYHVELHCIIMFCFISYWIKSCWIALHHNGGWIVSHHINSCFICMLFFFLTYKVMGSASGCASHHPQWWRCTYLGFLTYLDNLLNHSFSEFWTMNVSPVYLRLCSHWSDVWKPQSQQPTNQYDSILTLCSVGTRYRNVCIIATMHEILWPVSRLTLHTS